MRPDRSDRSGSAGNVEEQWTHWYPDMCKIWWVFGCVSHQGQLILSMNHEHIKVVTSLYLDNSRACVPLVSIACPGSSEGGWTAAVSAGEGRRWSPRGSSGPGGRAPPGTAPPPPPLAGVWSSRLGRAGGLVLGASWGGRRRLGTSRRPRTPRTRTRTWSIIHFCNVVCMSQYVTNWSNMPRSQRGHNTAMILWLQAAGVPLCRGTPPAAGASTEMEVTPVTWNGQVALIQTLQIKYCFPPHEIAGKMGTISIRSVIQHSIQGKVIFLQYAPKMLPLPLQFLHIYINNHNKKSWIWTNIVIGVFSIWWGAGGLQLQKLAQKWAKSRQTLASTPCKRNAHEDGKLLIKNLLLLCHRVWWCRGEPGTAAARGAVSDARVGAGSRAGSSIHQHQSPIL